MSPRHIIPVSALCDILRANGFNKGNFSPIQARIFVRQYFANPGLAIQLIKNYEKEIVEKL